jgi:glycosyltransferase involved in cell wall biosynthesis
VLDHPGNYRASDAEKASFVIPQVDLAMLTRHGGPLHPEVERGFREQRAVNLVVHRIVGSARSQDRCRWDAITRARNEGKLRGSAPWLMFLDDDVVLDPQCISTLVNELARRPAYAALAADYLGESREGAIASHVSMGATLFRRQVLEQLHFAWRDKKCECQCCCDELRRLHWGIDYCQSARARHLPKTEIGESPTEGECLGENSIITCMCVTRNRVSLLRRSVQCFLHQTYPYRELVIVYESDDDATRQFLAELRESSIHPLEVPAVPRFTLGSLRNIALQAGTGKYVAQWDDDDWHSPVRLAEQMKAIRETGKRACVLARWTLYNCLTRRAYVSNLRPWEGSIVVERAVVPPYPDLAKLEDTPVVEELIRHGQVTLLDRPDLYVYTYHGMNTWDGYHWKRIFRCSRPLGADTSGLLTALLNSEPHVATPLQTRLQNSIREWQSISGETAASRSRLLPLWQRQRNLLFQTAASHLPAMPTPTEPVSSGSPEDARSPGCRRIGQQPGLHQ